MKQAIPILVYHSVDTECSSAYRRWMVLPSEFDAHMGVLADNGYQPMTISNLATRLRQGALLPPRAIAITFDDGLADFRTGALPVLRRYGFPATLYVVSGYVGKTSRWLAPLGEGGRAMLNWRELRNISEAGIEIGAHSVCHPQLDILTIARASQEIAGSKRALEDGLGCEVPSFAYPHGYFNRKTQDIVRGAGFSSACRVRHALASDAEDLFALSRIVMTSAISAGDLHRLISGVALPVAPRAGRAIERGWRVVRRISRHFSVTAEPTAEATETGNM